MNSVPLNELSEELDYYVRRAETQLELAQQADNPAVVAAHYAIANAYLDLEPEASEPTAAGH